MTPITRSLLAFSFITLLFFSSPSLASGGHRRGSSSSMSAALVRHRERLGGAAAGPFKSSARIFKSSVGSDMSRSARKLNSGSGNNQKPNPGPGGGPHSSNSGPGGGPPSSNGGPSGPLRNISPRTVRAPSSSCLFVASVLACCFVLGFSFGL